MRSARAVLWTGSRLLSYPSPPFWKALPEVERSVADLPRSPRGRFERFLGHLRASDPLDVEQEYVRTFDLTDRTSLYLTYSRFGEGRDRGAALAALGARYRHAGFTLDTRELPDYLPLVLEFLAFASDPDAAPIAEELYGAVEGLAADLDSAHSPYADPVAPMPDALRAVASAPVAPRWGR